MIDWAFSVVSNAVNVVVEGHQPFCTGDDGEDGKILFSPKMMTMLFFWILMMVVMNLSMSMLEISSGMKLVQRRSVHVGGGLGHGNWLGE